MQRITVLTETMLAAGIPIEGLSGSGATCKIIFASTATNAHREQATKIVAGFDWRERQAKSLQQLTQEILALSALKQSELFAIIAAKAIQDDPQLALHLGIPIDGNI